jgi:hypothetical protein
MSSIDSASTLAAIAKLEIDLAKLKISLGATDVTVPKATKASKAKSAPKADGEKKPPNAWITFTQKVSGALKAADIATGAAPVSKQFASFLKDKNNAYDEWTAESIVEAWATWEKPEQSKMSKAASVASESEDATGSETKERKKRAPMTDEAKAAMKAKRAATVAAKKGEAAPAPVAVTEASETEAVPAPPAEAPAPVAEAPVKAFAKKVTAAKKGETVYTLEQLQDFEATTIEGVEYGKNARGDLVDGDGNFVGRWNSTTSMITRGAPRPADWESIMRIE